MSSAEGEGGAATDPSVILRTALRSTLERLEKAGARDEALAVVKDRRGIGPFKTQASMQPIGRAFRLGVILLDHEARLYGVGKITRATDTGREQNLSSSVEQRRADRQAARRGHFTIGEVVNYGFAEIPQDREHLTPDSDPLSFVDGRLFLRWGATATERRPLEAYLDDRASLLESEESV